MIITLNGDMLRETGNLIFSFLDRAIFPHLINFSVDKSVDSKLGYCPVVGFPRMGICECCVDNYFQGPFP
jgi:hypothetical protein